MDKLEKKINSSQAQLFCKTRNPANEIKISI